MRLIDADTLKQTFCAECVRTQCKDCNINYYFEHLTSTIDAVEVVRCKDCKYNYHNMIPGGEAEHGCTKCIELPITADFYCAWGEKNDDK